MGYLYELHIDIKSQTQLLGSYKALESDKMDEIEKEQFIIEEIISNLDVQGLNAYLGRNVSVDPKCFDLLHLRVVDHAKAFEKEERDHAIPDYWYTSDLLPKKYWAIQTDNCEDYPEDHEVIVIAVSDDKEKIFELYKIIKQKMEEEDEDFFHTYFRHYKYQISMESSVQVVEVLGV